MATKRINFATLNNEAIDTFSKFNKAYWALRALKDAYKSECAKIEASRNKILENRKNDLDAGIPEDEVIRKWSMVEVDKAQNALDYKFGKDCEPHNESIKEAMKLVDSDLYFGYILAQNKGSLDSKGSITIKKAKSTEEHELDKSYKSMIGDFLVKIGCSKTDDEKALSKFVNIMAVRTSGLVQCNKGENYVKVKSATQYNRLFMLNFLQYLVVERGLLVEDSEHNLTMKVFE